MQSSPLQAAFEHLMQAAPSPLFRRARRLYLNKYGLDGRHSSSPLRLFVLEEDIRERIERQVDAADAPRLVSVTIRPTRLALVHWQQADPANAAMVAQYFRLHWGLDLPPLTPSPEPWFRDGGHQSWLEPPLDLNWTRQSALPG